jgi:hypothetical protein
VVRAADVAAEPLLYFFLSQLLFDLPDDARGVGSALRGHSLMRSAWGLNYEEDNQGSLALLNNTVPFSGAGRLHHTYPDTAPPVLRGWDDFRLVNYTYFPADGFVRDPERFGPRSDLSAPRGPFTGGFNTAYTYPDLNSLFLGAAQTDGTLLVPSFHRPWLFGSLDPSNPNWTTAAGKYLILRPRPAEHPAVGGRPGFPYPDDATGDVKNLVNAPGGNDSVWLDLGFPVLTAPDGRKFKALFAPLVLDLDGRLNVNVHGNIRGPDGTQASATGAAPSDVGLNLAFANADEYRNIFLGLPGVGGGRRIVGRYGPSLNPAADSGHRFAASNMEKLLRFGDAGSGALTSELVQLCPQTFATVAGRSLVTTTSADLDRPGAAPWLWSDTTSGAVTRSQQYPYTPDKLLGGGPKPFPPVGLSVPPPRYSDFDPQGGRSLTAALGRIDLSQPLPSYPPANAIGQITDLASFNVAQSARQDLAREIYLRLIHVSGAYDPIAFLSSGAVLPNSSPPTPPELDTLRWLAQLAVNIVDDIDPDDISTPFNWAAVGSPSFRFYLELIYAAAPINGGGWVFGTEQPHVLINEVYAEYLNEPGDGADNQPASKYRVNLWVELFNPFRTDPALPNAGAARLDGAYQLVVSKPNNTLLSPRDMANVLGDPDGTQPLQVYDPRQVYSAHTWQTPSAIGAADQPGNGYVVLAPPEPVPGVNPGIPAVQPTMRSDALTYVVPVTVGRTPPQPTLLLRRLACPYLPWQPDPRTAPYNPYVTVDYAPSLNLNHGGTPFPNPPSGIPALPVTPIPNRRSAGRLEPYDGRDVAFSRQSPTPGLAGQPQHTFFAPNQPHVTAEHRLVRLDRPPVSPVELLNVPTCKPHQLTQMFLASRPDPYQQFRYNPYWVWDGNSPLYRLFEFLDAGVRVDGSAPGGRLPGKVNINSIWDRRVFQALCDRQPSNSFTDDDVTQAYDWMLAGRSPDGAPGPNDRPFRGLAAAQVVQTGDTYSEGDGLDDTLFRANPEHPLYSPARPIRLFEVAREGTNGAVAPAYLDQRFELLNKIFNQVTTRSNVFAVWVTVGFFEVNDATSMPVKLGAELGRTDNRHVRHRMFAIVDRSQPVAIFPAPGEPAVTSATAIPAAGPTTVVPTAMGTTIPGVGTWTIQPGAVLHVWGPIADGTVGDEFVVVTSVRGNSFTASFSRPYPRGLTSITAYGHPGPRSVLRMADSPAIVPYASVIQ